MSKELSSESAADPSLEFWPRVEQAINAAGVSRADMEYLAPRRCHKRNCKDCHVGPRDDLDRVMYYMKKAILETVYVEMLCRATSDPDLGDDE